MKVTYVRNKKLVEEPENDWSKKCKHEFETVELKETLKAPRYTVQACRYCYMKAHSDYRYSYLCGKNHCRCSS